MNNIKEYDFVVYGATGFTGKLVVEYLVHKYSNNSQIKWALAGRNLEKLESVAVSKNVPEGTGLLEVDSNNIASIEEMTSKTKCVLTTVGPYQLYGNDIVSACAKSGIDYVDLCGEPGWMHEKINQLTETARETGSRIVFSCGFDSIPFDLGVLFLQNEVTRRYGKPSVNVRGRVREMNGEFSGGTAASLGATMAALKEKPELFAVLANPFSLSNGFAGPDQPADNKPIFDDKLDTWVAPFFMAPINTKNVHRSNALMNHMYGKDFCYNEMWVMGPGDDGKAAADFISSSNPLSNAPKPGEGPSRESRENGNYDILFCGDINDESVHVSVVGDMDPGYGSTSKMIAESAICLVKECEDLNGGIYTPAPSMGTKLIKRLQDNAGLTFKIEN
tara:strand:+ start:4324 stop:5493 length:1170 start_codon:yes stop_codon:yes gene_type:complete